jgi:hypothetical protein
VASRLCLLENIGHAVPVDERLCELLVHEQVLEPGTTPEAASGWMDRHVRAEDALETYLLLQTWSDEQGHPPKRERRAVLAETRAARATNKPKLKAESHKSKAKPRS